MPMVYRDMCDEVRALMVDEIEYDGDALHLSSFFTAAGREVWKPLLIEAAQSGSDATLALALRGGPYIANFYRKRTSNGLTEARVPRDAHETIAESNFSRFYLRGLCRLAIAREIPDLIGYRAMQVMQPRRGSQEKIGARFPAEDMLHDIRATMATQPRLGIPPGVGSGILARLP